MFSRPKCPILDRLTTDPPLTIPELLLNEDLSTAIRHPSLPLLPWLKSPDPGTSQPRHEILLSLALSGEPVLLNCKLHEFSRVSSAVISSKVSMKIFQENPAAFLDRLIHFLNLPSSEDPFFAVHFARLFFKLFKVALDPPAPFQAAVKTITPRIISFVLNHSDLLAYSSFISDVLSQPIDVLPIFLPEFPPERFLAASLTAACRSVFRNFDSSNPNLAMSFESSRLGFKSQIFRDGIEIPPTPLNILLRPLPTAAPLTESLGSNDLLDANADRFWVNERPFPDISGPPRALPLLRALEDSSSGGGIVEAMQKFCQSLDLVKLLLICGIWGDDLIATTAFGILRNLLYPPANALFQSELYSADHPDDDSKAIQSYSLENRELENLVKEYAKGFWFSARPSPKMVAAFPLFWNHRYAVDGKEESAAVEFELPGGEKKVMRVEGKTPLEFYLPCLLEEPPQNDAFNLEIFEVMKYQVSLLSPKRNVKEGEEDYEKFYEEVMIGDLVFFELLRSPFKIGDERGSLRNLDQFLVVAPDSQERGGSAVVVDGFPFALARWIAEWDVFTMNGVFTSLFYKAEVVITPRVARHIAEVRVLMKKFREGRVKTRTDWDVVQRSSPPPPNEPE